jgi:hypothetical protein
MVTTIDEIAFDLIKKAEDVLTPQARMDLILSRDFLTETIDVRSATIVAANSEKIVLSQTESPIKISLVGEEIEATFLMISLVNGDQVRWGYLTTIQEILANRDPAGRDPSTPAIVIGPPNHSLKETNLRFHHRLLILPEYQISMDIPALKNPVSLLRISFGGADASLEGQVRIAKGQLLAFKLFFRDGSNISGDLEVRNIHWQEQSGKTLVGLKFAHLGTMDARHLERMVNRLMRLEKSPP